MKWRLVRYLLEHQPEWSFANLVNLMAEMSVVERSLPPVKHCRHALCTWGYARINRGAWGVELVCHWKKIEVEVCVMCFEADS